MDDPIVIDSSIILAVVLKEPEAAQIRAWLARVEHDGVPLIAPSHLWLEVMNPLHRRHRWDAAEVLGALRVIDSLGVTSIILDRPMLLTTNDLAERYGLTAYDAAYLATAIACDASLATLDQALAGAAGARLDPAFAADDPGAVREPEAAYEAGTVTWPGSPVAMSYLADLRRRALLVEP